MFKLPWSRDTRQDSKDKTETKTETVIIKTETDIKTIIFKTKTVKILRLPCLDTRTHMTEFYWLSRL